MILLRLNKHLFLLLLVFFSYRLEKNVRLHTVLDWLTDVCKSSLGSEVKYVLGPACPLQEKCSYAQHTRKKSGELHVIDLAEGLPISCGNIKVDNQVKVWLKVSSKWGQGVIRTCKIKGPNRYIFI